MKAVVQVLTFTLLLLLVGVVYAHVAYAHDIWLFPERFTLSQGDTLTVRQLAGSELDPELELELLRDITPRFELMTPDGSIDLLSELPDTSTRPVLKPVLKRKLDFDGLALLTMEHDFFHTALSTEKFLQYLKEEEFKLEKFQDQIESRPQQRERFARTLKCLVQVGKNTEEELYKRVLGQKAEIVLLQNPYRLDPGDDLEVQVLFNGKPLPDQLVMALNGDGRQSVSRSKARTSADGIARLPL